MSGYLFYSPRYRPNSATGGTYPGATLTIYLSQTTTLTPIYSDVNLVTAISNPIKADAGGLFAAFFLSPSIAYRIILKDKNGVVIFDQDPYIVLNSPFGTSLTVDDTGHLEVPTPSTAGAGITVNGTSANAGYKVRSPQGQDAAIEILQLGLLDWVIVSPANSTDLRIRGEGTDLFTLTNQGDLTIPGNLTVGSTSIIGLATSAVKVLTTTAITSTAFTNDPELVIPNLSPGTYSFTGLLFPVCTTTTTQGFKFALSFVPSVVFGTNGLLSGTLTASGFINGASIANVRVAAATNAIAYPNVSTTVGIDYLQIDGVFVIGSAAAPNAATTSMYLQWGQNTSSANATALYPNSFLTVLKIS